MGYILVYLLIRIYKGKAIEITETVSDSTSFSNNQPVHPFDDTKFIIAYGITFDALDDTCIYESTYANVYQYEIYRDENYTMHLNDHYYDLEPCNNTHFSEKDFEDIPLLSRMN